MSKIEIDLYQVSAILVEPKQAFLDWLSSVVSLKETYSPEENGLWIIPSAGSFQRDSDLAAYLENIKPKLLESEVGRFSPAEKFFQFAYTAETFDKFFKIKLLDYINDARGL